MRSITLKLFFQAILVNSGNTTGASYQDTFGAMNNNACRDLSKINLSINRLNLSTAKHHFIQNPSEAARGAT